MSAEGSTSRFHVPGKTRWRRFAIVAVPAVAIAGVLVGLTAEGAIASSISVSGEEYTVKASQLSGTGFEQFGGEVSNAKRAAAGHRLRHQQGEADRPLPEP